MYKINFLLIKEGLREIKQGKSQFFPLFCLSALWICIFVGLSVSLKSVEQSFLQVYESTNGFDLQIKSVLPLTEVEVESLQKTGYNVQGNYESHIKIQGISKEYDSRLISFDPNQTINQIHLLEGRLPENEGECVVSPSFLEETSYSIGDYLYFFQENVELELQTEEALIVGVGQAAPYLSNHYELTKYGDGLVYSQIYLHFDGFSGDYTSIYLKNQSESELQAISSDLQKQAEGQWERIGDSYILNSENHLNEANMQVESAVLRAEEEISRLEYELVDLEEEISSAWFWFAEDDLGNIDEINELEVKYSEKLLEIQEYQEKNEVILADLRKIAQQAQRDFELFSTIAWELTPKEESLSYSNFYHDMDAWRNFTVTVPSVFFWIFTVISFFVMTRMIAEQRSLIGGLIGQGYRKREIIQKYLVFSFSCAIFSVIFAHTLAITVISFAIHHHWSHIYSLSPYEFEIYPEIMFFALVLSSFLLFITTFFPFIFFTRGEPVNLMRPKAPPVGRSILLEKNYFLWNELNFNQKIAVRTLFRHKSRLFMNITAIAITTSFVVTALGVQETYPSAAQSQFREIYHYTTEITAKNNTVDAEFLEIQGVLSEYGLNHRYSVATCEEITIDYDGQSITADTYIFNTTKEAEKVINFRLGRFRTYYMPETGVVIPSKISDLLDLPLGDSLLLRTEHGESEAMVTAVAEQYHENRMYMTADYYQWLTGETAKHNKIFLDLTDNILESPELLAEFHEKILSIDCVESLIHVETLYDDYTSSNNLLKNAMLAFLIASCLLAFLVLNQLNNNTLVFRRRELATLKVLGLFDRELSAYVYRENILYTFLGLMLGMVFGQNLYLWFVKSIETDDIMLYRSIPWDVFLRGAGSTMVIALIVNIYSHFKIKKLNIAEELKQTE